MSDTINSSYISTKVSCPQCLFERIVRLSSFNKKNSIKCPNCSTVFKYNYNCIFDSHNYSDISPDAFTHPLDKQTINVIRKIPGFDYVLRKMMEYGYEKYFRVNAMANDVKVTKRTFSHIYDMVNQASECLGVQVPDVYVNQDPIPNAYTMGTEYPIIMIQSGLIELLTDDELYSVIAHEVTHIKCHHVLYHMLGRFLVETASALGIVGAVIVPLNLALYEWNRKSELSADRGSLIVTNNKSSAIKLLMKIAGGSDQLSSMIDENEFVLQAEQFENLTAGINLNKVYRVASNIWNTHPFPVLRAYEINKWSESDEYKKIFDGVYENRVEKDSITQCPHCGEILEAGSFTCISCGQNIERLTNQYKKIGYHGFFENIKTGINNQYEKMENQDFIKNLKSGINNIMSDYESNHFYKKICPVCKKDYSFFPDTNYCSNDGEKLVNISIEK